MDYPFHPANGFVRDHTSEVKLQGAIQVVSNEDPFINDIQNVHLMWFFTFCHSVLFAAGLSSEMHLRERTANLLEKPLEGLV